MNAQPTLSRNAFGLLASLVVQYLLGMAINLYVTFPEFASDGQRWEFAWKQPVVAAHIVVAIGLLIGSLSLVIRAYHRREVAWKVPALVGFLAILMAGFAGSQFIPTQNDPYSYLMAACFIGAFAAYCWGLYRAK
jgi:hypothetical protein